MGLGAAGLNRRRLFLYEAGGVAIVVEVSGWVASGVRIAAHIIPRTARMTEMIRIVRITGIRRPPRAFTGEILSG